MRVLISGIGIAGPTLAYWLAVHGFEITLVERAPRLRGGGYMIDFWGTGFDVAERMGLLPAIKRDGYNIKQFRLVNAGGKHIGGFNVDAFRTATKGRYLSIARSDLARNIYQKIQDRCEMIFGDSIAGIKEDAAGVEVDFEHATPRRFDIVIGADGLHSRVRKLVFGNENSFEKFLGFSVAAFEAGGYQPRNDDIYVSFSPPGKQIGRISLRHDRTLFLFVFLDERGNSIDPYDTMANKKILRAQFGGLGWECPEILAAMESCDELYFDSVSQIRLDSWSRGRVALVGDAAFCPSLLAGQGSALAMAAAYVLAGELGKPNTTPQEAFKRYETLLRPFIVEKQTAAEKFAGSFVPKTPLGLFFRNQVMKMLSIQFILKLAMGSTLADRFKLPDYPETHAL